MTMKIYLHKDRKDVFLNAYLPDTKTGGELRPAALICPGGGYRLIGTTEGVPVAERFLDAGFAAFVLHYSIGEDAVFGEGGFSAFKPILDLRGAMALLHERAEDFGIDPKRIVLSGFSAGGHLAAAWCFSGAALTPTAHGTGTDADTSANLPPDAPAAAENLLPAALVLAYSMGGGSDSGGAGKGAAYDIAEMEFSQDPATKKLPVFFWHAKDDMMVPFHVSEKLEKRLVQEHIPHVFRRFEHGVHTQPFSGTDSWFDEMLSWLALQGTAKGDL
jgi:acetyl esterase/lipase